MERINLKPVIVCVDDELTVVKSLKEQLLNSLKISCNIEIATDPIEALSFIEELNEDGVHVPVVISDYIMPNVTGDKFLAQVHNIMPRSKKILLTGHASIEGVQNAINSASLYRYIEKPWEFHDFELMINAAIKSYYNEIEIRNLNIEIEAMLDSFIDSVVTSIESMSTYTANHTKSVSYLCSMIAININSNADKDIISKDELKSLIMAAKVHDMGKIFIPINVLDKTGRFGHRLPLILERLDFALECKLRVACEAGNTSREHILNRFKKLKDTIIAIEDTKVPMAEYENEINELKKLKINSSSGLEIPVLEKCDLENLNIMQGTLSDAERTVIMQHVDYTEQILSKIRFGNKYASVPDIARMHHEKLNGTGYPLAKKAEEIPFLSRILIVADIAEALLAKRPYKDPCSPETVRNILFDMADKGQLDKQIVSTLNNSNIIEEFIELREHNNI